MEYKLPIRKQFSNKGTFGKVLNFSGSKNYIGAAYLSSVSVLKSGAGYIALATEDDVINKIASILPEAVYFSVKEGINKINQFDVVIIGCGLGTDRKSVSIFKSVINKLQNKQTPTIIDADGLNILANTKIKLPSNVIITPHPAEAARLLNCETKTVLSDLEEAARLLTQKYNCITVLKNHRTIICDKNLEIFINNHGNSALSKAGTGDVLAGIIAGLSAQNKNLYEMAKLGVYLHSRTGEILSDSKTEYSVLASDIPNFIHLAIKELL